MKFKVQNSKLKVAFIFSLLALFGVVFTKTVSADVVTDNAINYLKSQQEVTGKIANGFSAPSQWSAIAFTENDIDVATVKNPTASLQDFLATDVPASTSAATDWEPRILAIVAIGADPTNFGGINYVSNLQSFHNNSQLGDTCSLNDDIFGLLALIASGPTADTQIKQDVLQFLISKQDTTDGGFGSSAPGCAFYGTSADMTGAGLQALVEAKNNGLTASGLDTAIDKAKAYLLANQDADGGFGYFGSSDTDTTGWVLMALNVLGMQDSDQATKARSYLISQQSATDGGIKACNTWDPNTFACIGYASNSTTTAQALIALTGKGWIVRIFDPATAITVSVTPTPIQSGPTVTPTDTPTMTPTPTPGSSSNSNGSTSTPTPTPTPLHPSDSAGQATLADMLNSPLVSPTPSEDKNDFLSEITGTPQAVLGASDTDTNKPSKDHTKGIVIAGIFTGLGLLFIFIYLAKPFIIRRFK